MASYDSPSATIAGGGKRKEKPWSHPDRKWEVRDAMRTIMRANEHLADKKLMEQVKICAADEAQEMRDVARQAETLAKSGKISEKEMAKLHKR